MAVDALSALDESFLRLETESVHMHIGWTMFVEGARPSLRELRAHVSERLERVPRFRRRVLSSRLMLHDPVWVDDERFDIAEHVRLARVPAGGSPAATRRLAGQLLSVPLDRERPLWRLYLLDGLEGGRFAMVGQAHHALVDGAAAVEMAQLLLDDRPVVEAVSAPRFDSDPSPNLMTRARASAAERLGLARRAGSLALRTLSSPTEATYELQRLGSALAAVGARAPATALNRPIGPDRSVAFARLSLHAARQLGRRHGATVNDIVLATATLALGRYLRRGGESHPWLRALVPVNTRDADGTQDQNRTGAMFVELPVGERDPRAVLAEVSRQTAQKQARRPRGTDRWACPRLAARAASAEGRRRLDDGAAADLQCGAVDDPRPIRTPVPARPARAVGVSGGAVGAGPWALDCRPVLLRRASHRALCGP